MHLIYLIFGLLVLALVTESIVELVIKSTIFKPVRVLISRLGDWTAELMRCGYCFSVWVAFPLVYFSQVAITITDYSLLNAGLTVLVVHRLSNILHNMLDKWTDKYYDVRYVNTEKES